MSGGDVRAQWGRSACVVSDDQSLKSRRAFAAYMELRHRSLALDELSSDEKSEWQQMERGWVHGCREFRERMGDLLMAEVQWVSEQLVMGNFKTVSRAMKFYDGAIA